MDRMARNTQACLLFQIRTVDSYPEPIVQNQLRTEAFFSRGSHNDGPSKARRVAGRLSHWFICPPSAVESMFAFIDNVAERRKKKREKITHPSRLRVKRQRDASDSLSCRRNGCTTEFTEVGTLRAGRVGGGFVGLNCVITVWGNYGNFWTGFDFCAANDAEEFGVYGRGGALPDVGNWGPYWDFL